MTLIFFLVKLSEELQEIDLMSEVNLQEEPVVLCTEATTRGSTDYDIPTRMHARLTRSVGPGQRPLLPCSVSRWHKAPSPRDDRRTSAETTSGT